MRALINAEKAYQEGVPVSEYVREMVHDHILQMGACFRETGARLRALSEAKRTVGDFCHELFKLDSDELSFLESLFENKRYVIGLLFPNADHLRDHPGMKWRLQQMTDGSRLQEL